MSSIKKKGLGRGLSALFGDEKIEQKEKKFNDRQNKVLIGDLTRNTYQPRLHFDEVKLEELSNSIKKNGIIQPIAVRPDKNNSERYEIVAGERRWLAAQKAGLHEVPIVILDLDDNEALEISIVENIQRDDLNVIEEAKGYKRLADEFEYDHEKISFSVLFDIRLYLILKSKRRELNISSFSISFSVRFNAVTNRFLASSSLITQYFCIYAFLCAIRV